MSSPTYGRRLIPHIIDERAHDTPERAVYSIPVDSADLSKGFKDISAFQLANAINRVAWWVQKKLGLQADFPTIGYMGPHDMRYVILVLGCIKAGYKLLLISPRNSVDADLAVIERSKCDNWILPKQHPDHLEEVFARHPMKILHIAEAEEILCTDLVPHFAYDKTFEEAKSEPFCVLHTSGSTGHPKPIIWKHSLLATLDASRLLPEHEGRPPWVVIFGETERFYSAFPFFHAAGAIMNMLINPFFGTCNVIGPVGQTPSITLIDLLLDFGQIRIWSIIPSIVDDIGETPEVRSKFSTSKIIIASGGPVSYESANKATASVRVMNLTGTSEGLFMGSLLPSQEDWIYFSFHPYVNFDFREIDPGVFEHYIVRDERYVEMYQGYFHTFPGETEMTLKDLYIAHPTKPGLWLYKGRTDDLVVLSNGEKIHPTAVEAAINRLPAVGACLAVGTGETHSVLLIEPAISADSPKAQENIRESVWQVLQEVNKTIPTHARIYKEYVMFMPQGKSFSRTDKNTVKRRMTVMEIQPEIDQFFKDLDAGASSILATNLDVSSVEMTIRGVEALFAEYLAIRPIRRDQDITQIGVDSMSILRIARRLRAATAHMQDSADVFAVLTPALVYENPTAERLGTALFGLFNRGVGETIYVNGVDEHLPETLLQRYVQDLPSAITGNKQLRNGGNKIILTGSSGSLGSYILDTLLRQETVSHIFCLNRANDAETIQIEQAKQRDLRTIFPPFKVTFLQADLASPNLGLSDEAYEILSHDATHIVHAAWPVNFNMSLSSFEPSIRGVRNLISLAVTSRHAASLAFISSVATVAHLRDDAPEEPIPIFPPSATGYALSKHVSELLLQAAWARSGLDASVVRVGQIAGPVRRTAGAWSPHEMLPTLIATAKHLRLLPETLGPADRIDWIPVDIAADALVEVCGAADVPSVRAAPSTLAAPEEEEDAERTSVPTFNVANPETCEWADLLPTIRAQLGGEDVALVGWVEWVGAVEALETSPERDGVPGLKLLKTFQDMRQAVADGVAFPRLETERAELRSGTLASLTPVSAEWMALWLAQWQL